MDEDPFEDWERTPATKAQEQLGWKAKTKMRDVVRLMVEAERPGTRPS